MRGGDVGTTSGGANIGGKTIMKAFAFIIAIGISGFVLYMLIYTVVYNRAKKNSRCQRLKDKYVKNTTYSVDGMAGDGTKLYTISYNLGTKQSAQACACPNGDVLNNFPFHVRDMRNKVNQDVTMKCSCDAVYDDNEGLNTIYYTGYPALVDYMNDPTRTGFF